MFRILMGFFFPWNLVVHCRYSFNFLFFIFVGSQLFSWGSNSHGQLGLGKTFASQKSPQQVKSLYGIPLAQVAAGGNHSFALSLAGTSFGWGSNNVGQLALSGRNVPGKKNFFVAMSESLQFKEGFCHGHSQRA